MLLQIFGVNARRGANKINECSEGDKREKKEPRF